MEQNEEEFLGPQEEYIGLTKRLRYKTFHRNQDRDLLRKSWPVQDHNWRFVEDAPPNVRKKFQKAVKVNLPYWKQILLEISACIGNQENERRWLDKVRKSVNATIPKVNGNRVSDATEMFRLSSSDFRMSLNDAMTGSGYGFVYFWVVYRSLELHFRNSEFEMCIKDCDEMLHLLPPLSDQVPIPHPFEIQVLHHRAQAHSALQNHRVALEDAECCGAALRLIIYIDNDKSKQDILFFITSGDIFKSLVQLAITEAVKLKLQNNVPRPLFSTVEKNDIEKRWGVGIFHPRLYCCHHCGITRAETRLILCSGCNRAWVCGEECHARGWTKHKTRCKRISRKSTMPLTTNDYENTIKLIEKEKAFLAYGPDYYFRIYCRDPISGKIFDAWEDNDVCIDEKSQKEEGKAISKAVSSVTMN